MQTFRQQIKQSLTLFLFIATFLSCSNIFAETTDTDAVKAEHHAQNNLWSGVFQGFLPCDDCKGIKTSLALNKNNTYILITQYVGKSDREIVEKGTFTFGNQDNTIVLTPRKNPQTRHYFIGENTLTQLDSEGNHIVGDSGDRYVLRKNEMNNSKTQASHH